MKYGEAFNKAMAFLDEFERLYAPNEADEQLLITNIFAVAKEYYESQDDLEPENEYDFPDKILKISGVTYRCTCGCNVFKEYKPLKYRCNSCGATFTGERQ